MPDLFQSPSEIESSGGDFPKVRDLHKRLLIIEPTKFRSQEIQTKFGLKDAVVANVIVVNEDEPAKSEQYNGMHFLEGQLIGKLKGLVDSGKMVLGRIGQVPTDKGNPAWVLEDPSAADKAVATTAHTALNAPPF